MRSSFYQQGGHMTNNKITRHFNNVGLVRVTVGDLPLCCPMPHMALWDAHPRVYLPIEATGSAVCPYCSAEYQLELSDQELPQMEKV